MPRTKEQYKDIRRQKTELILDTALKLFAENGFHNTSISQIAEKAEISKGLIYNYFNSKIDLLLKIVERGMTQFLEVFDTNKDGFLTEEEFENYLNIASRMIVENVHYWKLYYSLIFQTNVVPLIHDKLMELSKQYIEILTDYYRRHNSSNPEAEALLLTITLDGLAMAFVNDMTNFSLDEIKKLILKKFK